jgi:hypothetical protein
MRQPQTKAQSTHRSVAVVIERRRVCSGRWETVSWRVDGVVPRPSGEPPGAPTLIHSDSECSRFLHTGLQIDLYKDETEGYWYNLMADTPCLFVVCYPADADDDDDSSLVPFLVTANQDAANGHMETDDPVFSVAMPPDICKWLERYVVENYVPEQKKKRKRKNWSEDAERGARPGRRVSP